MPSTKATYWNSVFQNARARLRWLEAVETPTEESKQVAEDLRFEWSYLTLPAGEAHPERLHQDRHDRYHKRVRIQIKRHTYKPPVLRIVK